MAVLRSKRVVTPDGVHPAAIHLEGETIARISDHADARRDVIDFADLVIMPGIVDSHVHVNEPGRTEWEGFDTATRAAAAGGVTTIVDMPLNSIPPTTTVDALYEKAHAMEPQIRVDVGLWGGVIPGNLFELKVMLEEGARGFKCFLVDSGVEEFPRVGEAELRAAARELAGTGAPLLVHAELPGPIEAAHAHGKPDAYDTYLHSRPPAAEEQAIELLLEVAEESGAWIHVVHLSAAGALEIFRRARERGARLTTETTPHYLHFDAGRIPDGKLEYKCAPPIREGANRDALWRGLGEGLIGMVVSDHSPCTPELKRGDFMSAWGGISSLQLILPVVWTEAERRGHSIGDVARWICEGPARLARFDKKGSIAVGNDADFVIWSPEESFLVEPTKLEHRHKVTPYAGERLRGAVHETWLRGHRIFGNGHHAGDPRGTWLR